MAEVNEVSGLPAFHRVERIEALKVTVLGIIVGLAVPLLGNAISMWVIEPIFCQDASNFTTCANGGMIAYYVSSTLVTIMAIGLLVNWGVYRPLLIGLGALVALWGFKKFVDPIIGVSFYEYLAISALLFGLSYLVFYWFMRVRHFGVSLALAAVAATAIRWVLLI